MKPISNSLLNFLTGTDPHFLYADLISITTNPTNVSTSTVSLVGAGDVLNSITGDGNVFAGGLDQANLLTESQTFGVSPWTMGQASITATNITDPNNGATASAIAFTGTTGNAFLGQILTPTLFGVSGNGFMWSIYIKLPSGSQTIQLTIENQAAAIIASTTVTVSSSWQRFSLAGLMGGGDTGIRVFISNPSVANTYHIWGAQLEYNFIGVPTPYNASREQFNSFSSAYSSTLLPTSVNINGIPFSLNGTPTVATFDATIALPASKFSQIQVLATGVNGAQLAQQIVVNYVGGTNDTFTQSLSDWFIPQSFPGESIGLQFAYRNLSNGTKDTRPFNLYLYTFNVNSTKTLSTIVFPNNRNVTIFAITCIAGAGRNFFFTTADVDVKFNNNVYRSGRGDPGVNLIPDSDGLDFDWTVDATVVYQSTGGFVGGGSWVYTGTGSPSGFHFPKSKVFFLTPGIQYAFSSFIDATNVTVLNPFVGIYDPNIVSHNYAGFIQTIGVKGRASTTFIIPIGLIDNFTTFSNWTNEVGTFTVAGNKVSPSTFSASHAMALYTNSILLPVDQSCQMTIAANAAGAPICVVVRGQQQANPSVNTYYAFGVDGTSNTWSIFKVISGTVTTLISGSRTPALNDVIKLTVVGSVLTAFVNGVQIGTTTDSSIATGIPGIAAVFGSSQQSGSNWSAGTMTYSVPVVVIFDTANVTVTNGLTMTFSNAQIEIGSSITNYCSTNSVPVFERDTITWKTGLDASRAKLKVYSISQNIALGTPFLQALAIGKFEDALVSIDRLYMQFPGDTSLGIVNLFKGNIGEISQLGRTYAEIDVDTKLAKLNIQMPRNVYQDPCRWVLYDAGCALLAANFAVSGSVSAGSNSQYLNTSLTNVDSYFNQGKLVWTSGQNNGLSFSVRLYFNASGQVILYRVLPFPPQVGDTFTIYPGCDKSASTCLNKFNNIANFRGEPDTPPPELAA